MMPQNILRTRGGKLRLSVVVVVSFIITFLGLFPGFTVSGLLLMYPGILLIDLIRWVLGYPGILSSLPGDAIFTYTFPLSVSVLPFLVLAYLVAFRAYGGLARRKQWGIWLMMYCFWSLAGVALIMTVLHLGMMELPQDFHVQLQKLLESGSGAKVVP